ncbi:unnamed protein product [Caenorhabditis bovis]|uniref:Uncharacterized protein n=1 Tax=Caenorhabditis bovis TaxID=2654633 RepID=A0A8S1EGB2_9PELO|nr:unnamed protein product [Caenorhabditis bovis]
MKKDKQVEKKTVNVEEVEVKTKEIEQVKTEEVAKIEAQPNTTENVEDKPDELDPIQERRRKLKELAREEGDKHLMALQLEKNLFKLAAVGANPAFDFYPAYNSAWPHIAKFDHYVVKYGIREFVDLKAISIALTSMLDIEFEHLEEYDPEVKKLARLDFLESLKRIELDGDGSGNLPKTLQNTIQDWRKINARELWPAADIIRRRLLPLNYDNPPFIVVTSRRKARHRCITRTREYKEGKIDLSQYVCYDGPRRNCRGFIYGKYHS